MNVENLKSLLAVGERLLAFPRTYTLGFGSWDCGEFACFAGHYEREHHVGLRLNGYFGAESLASVCEHFAISPQEAFALFQAERFDAANRPGEAAYEELERRLVYLRDLIARREQNVERAIHDAARADIGVMPAIIRELFIYRPAREIEVTAFSAVIDAALEEQAA